MPQTLLPTDAVELAVVERDGFIESRHLGAAVVVSPEGTIAQTLGTPDALVLPRSALKPAQVLACLAVGASLDAEQIGVAAGSHTGTERHVSVVRSILYAAGLGEDHLDCPAAWPLDQSTRDELVRDLGTPAPVRMSCSGTHAAMLAACVANAWPTDGYLDSAHPLQLQIRETVERLTGARVAHTSIDDCGAPAPAVTLEGLARATHRIATSSERSPFALHRHAGTLVRAIRENPWTVAGDERPDSIVAARLGVFAKSGSEGVVVAAAPDGATAAVTVLDGSPRAAMSVALRLLQAHGALPAAAVAETTSALPSPGVRHGRGGASLRTVV